METVEILEYDGEGLLKRRIVKNYSSKAKDEDEIDLAYYSDKRLIEELEEVLAELKSL